MFAFAQCKGTLTLCFAGESAGRRWRRHDRRVPDERTQNYDENLVDGSNRRRAGSEYNLWLMVKVKEMLSLLSSEQVALWCVYTETQINTEINNSTEKVPMDMNSTVFDGKLVLYPFITDLATTPLTSILRYRSRFLSRSRSRSL